MEHNIFPGWIEYMVQMNRNFKQDKECELPNTDEQYSLGSETLQQDQWMKMYRISANVVTGSTFVSNY